MWRRGPWPSSPTPEAQAHAFGLGKRSERSLEQARVVVHEQPSLEPAEARRQVTDVRGAPRRESDDPRLVGEHGAETFLERDGARPPS